jgi:hypothetical protein
MPARCPNCSETLAAGARFCPRCGNPAPEKPAPGPPHTSVDFGKISAPLPRAGVLFLLALVLAPAAIIAGLALGLKALVYLGVALAVALVVLLILGNFL